MRKRDLDAGFPWPYARAMIHAATIVIARRRRIFAAGLDVWVQDSRV